MWIASLLLVSLYLVAPAQAAPDPGLCDRSGDYQLTTLDALIALQAAVNNCRTSLSCDADGDYEETVTDALVLLRAAVYLPVNLQCSCIYADECFEDADCVGYYGPPWRCGSYVCVLCESDDDCGEGETCDRCRYECVRAVE